MELATLIAACIAAGGSIWAVCLNIYAKKKERRMRHRKKAYLNFLRLAIDMPFNNGKYSTADAAVAKSYAYAVGTEECADLIEKLYDHTVAYIKNKKEGDEPPSGSVDDLIERIIKQMRKEFQRDLR